MFLAKTDLKQINTITHEGKVIVFVTDSQGQIYYTIKQDGYEESYGNTDVTGWENWDLLPFPNEDPDPSVIEKEAAELTDQNNHYLLRSRYQTQSLTAVTPIQCVSGLGHLYVFRQSVDNTLLVDRFVLDGLTHKLVRKLEVRFKRSKQKHQPLQNTNNSSTNSLGLVDSLDFRDTEGNPFYEPTTELPLINQLSKGWFSVVLLPTNEHDKYRWHFYAYNQKTQQIDILSIRASSEGLFNIQDETVLEPKPGEPETLIPRSIPGIIQRSINLENLTITQGLSATSYDTQVERTIEGGTQLLKESTKVLLAVVTDQGTATLSFGVAGDGTLATLDETPVFNLVRNDAQDLLLPLDTLDEIKSLGESTPPPQGTITGMARTSEDLVQITSKQAKKLQYGDVIKIEGTQHYNGHYIAQKVDDQTFEIQAHWVDTEVGQWEVIPEEETGLIFDGIITAYELTENGNIRVISPNHGLENGDEVQIINTQPYNDIYAITAIDGDRFTVNIPWQPGEAVNLKLASRKRRGVSFDGKQDSITLPSVPLKPPSADYSFAQTYTVWVYLSAEKTDKQVLIAQKEGLTGLFLQNNQLSFNIAHDKALETLTSPESLPIGQWVHCAGSFAYDADSQTTTLTLCQNGQAMATKTFKGVPLVANNWKPEFSLAGVKNKDFFAGKLANVRIWNTAKPPQDIKDTMYLQLTGREVNLSGYWRLGAISEGKERTVVDFSVHGNHGIVHGDAFVSAITLNRTLGDGKTPSVKYSNPELVAVTQRGTYTESFEFKLNTEDDPNNLEGKPLFKFSYWGKSSRNAQNTREIIGETAQFQPLGEGWYQATGRFTVPDGVTLVRSFEISDIEGNWQFLDLRKHRIRLVSDTITQAIYQDKITLEPLNQDYDELKSSLQKLDPLEKQEAALLEEKRRLEAALAAVRDPNLATRIRNQEGLIRILKGHITRYEGDVTRYSRDYQTQVNDPWNYWHRLTTRSREGKNEAARIYTQGKNFIQGLAWGNYSNQKFKFERVDGTYFTIICQYENRILDMQTFGNHDIYGNTDHHKGANQQWRLERRGNYYLIYSRYENRVMDLRNRSHSIYGHNNPHGKDNQQFRLTRLNEQANNKIRDAQRQLTTAQGNLQSTRQRLQQAETELARLQAISANKANEEAKLTAQLNQVLAQLQTVQTELNSLNTAFIAGVQTLEQTPQTMAIIGRDSRQLAVSGALLTFVRPASRLTCLATSEGNVELIYVDTDGKMRQTRFDVTADSANIAFEQWIPEGLRTCLSLNQADSMILLKDSEDLRRNAPIPLTKDWTVETWFFSPLPHPFSYNTLVRAETAPEHPVLVKNEGSQRLLGTYVNGQFYPSGFDMERLPFGWHHLAVVGQGEGDNASTTFYIDGQVVGQVEKAKTSSDIYAIGNYQGGTQPFGKLAALGIWQIALKPEEIEIHSKMTLRGNEPGLMAYFPLNEATGEEVRDHSGNGRLGRVEQGNWWGCSAPIGNPGHAVMQFNGVNTYVEISHDQRFNLSNNFTLEAWVKPRKVTGIQRIFSKAGAYGFGLNGNQLRFTTYGRKDYDTQKGKLTVDQWHHLAVVLDQNNTAHFYVNGALIDSIAGTVPANTSSHPCEIGRDNRYTNEFCDGYIAEVRLWKTARSQGEIQETRLSRLNGTEPDLVAYWPLDQLDMMQSPSTVADLTEHPPGIVRDAVIVEDNALPLINSALVSAEYSTISLDPDTDQKMALMRRFFALPSHDGIQLFSDKRVEALDLRWIGNAQFAPTLLGYIEGAPPVPSENLTLEDDYNGATAVELSQSQDVDYSWTRSQESGLGASFDLFTGVDEDIRGGPLVVSKRIAATRAGFKGNLDFTYNFLNESNITASSSSQFSDRLELRGTQEPNPKFPHLGKRFIPKNVGYALVVSGLADVFVTRLRRSGRMVGYQVLPVEDVPPDVNTITFLINPAYTMNGSLDGQTGSEATSERFFKHVPEMRSQYGSLYPASYYRLQEAYDLKQQIENEDARRASYFAQFNARLVDETSLNREIDRGEAPQTVTVNRQEEEGLTEEEQAAQRDNIERQGQENVANRSQAVEAKQREIESKIADQEQRTQAVESFAGWQKKMEDIQIRAGKRNIVNTYVWDGDGGLRTEAQSFASTVEHSIGGSFNLNAGLGAEGNFNALGVAVELTAQATVNLTQTLNKTQARSEGFSLNVDLSGVESRNITNHDDYPLFPGQKVDRYRFMSFYLEGNTQHFQDFFNYVVDPEWLASNDEEARALRQIDVSKANKTWRVLHRVTYVERPALMGFGQLSFPLPMQESPSTQDLLGKLEQLEQDKQLLSDKVDKILYLLQSAKF
ncbi:LamG-like jellyroll fold domain-containing protein [Cyanothece sp. BG0011]|uniref:LamG-like jellyroll fold domain-containing protein n=1 Tax=Cyanothece sp. BG0011 TaxID=2082950 RepID=UPI000D1F212D|nr:LamG-like jellyroll fold domain-containing protein [Cyanothece sp. BG0011]